MLRVTKFTTVPRLAEIKSFLTMPQDYASQAKQPLSLTKCDGSGGDCSVAALPVERRNVL